MGKGAQSSWSITRETYPVAISAPGRGRCRAAVWDLAAPDDLFEIYAKGTVRAAMVLSKQPPGNLTAIRSALTAAVREQFARGDR